MQKKYGKWKPFLFSDLVVEELITLAVFSSVSKGGTYIHAMGDERYDIIKDFFTVHW